MNVRIVGFILCAVLFASAGVHADSNSPTNLVLIRATVMSVHRGLAACKAPEPLKTDSGQEQILLIEGDCFALDLRVDRVFDGQFEQRTVTVHSMAPHAADYRIGRKYLVVERRDGDKLDLKYFAPLAKGLCPDGVDMQMIGPDELAQLRDWEQRFPCR